jgi:hypothetical protein
MIIVATICRVRPDQMKSRRRPGFIAWPRQIAMCLSYQCTDQSLEEVGAQFGGRDHGTVMHAVKTVNDSFGDKGRWGQFCSCRSEVEKQLGMIVPRMEGEPSIGAVQVQKIDNLIAALTSIRFMSDEDFNQLAVGIEPEAIEVMNSQLAHGEGIITTLKRNLGIARIQAEQLKVTATRRTMSTTPKAA